jgi:hypothetical protein
MQLNVGILIIGSLYWRMDERKRWRHKRLRSDREWHVRVPIRYGRLSRGGTYTMVFAQLTADQAGQGRAIECQHVVSSASDLIAEAEWLWSAESNNVPRLCFSSPERRISAKAKWGCVALLRNPHREIPQQLLDCWADRVSKEPDYNANDRRLVDNRGILQIDWPDLVDGCGPVPLDLLLATSNDPETTYPSVEAVAGAWNQQKGAGRHEYFSRNRASGICTFQDQEIEKLLN